MNSAVGAITRGLVRMLKKLLPLLFRFMRTLPVTKGSVLLWQEFSSLSVGPGDARLAVITFQIGIGVHERRRFWNWERLHATWISMKKTGCCTVVLETFSSSLNSNNWFNSYLVYWKDTHIYSAIFVLFIKWMKHYLFFTHFYFKAALLKRGTIVFLPYNS